MAQRRSRERARGWSESPIKSVQKGESEKDSTVGGGGGGIKKKKGFALRLNLKNILHNS